MKKQPALSVVLKCRLLLDNIGGAGLTYLYDEGALRCYAREQAERRKVAEQKAACTGVHSRRLADVRQQ